MTKSLLVFAACLFAAPAASAQVQNSTPGSSGANNVGAAVSTPAAGASATSTQKVQNATPGSSGANSVNAAVGPQATAPAPAASASTSGHASAGQGSAGQGTQAGMQSQAQMQAQAQTFNPGAYGKASDCLTAAAAAHAALSQCSAAPQR
jgi:hypothetical protein